MSILAKVGERLYEFESQSKLTAARIIYVHFCGSQDEFEEQMELKNINFHIEDNHD